MTSKYVLTGISMLFVLTALTACGGGGGGGAAPAPPAPNSTFTTQPTSVTVTAPNTATFNVAATGTPTPTLQWQLSTDGGTTWGNIAGAIGSSYTTPATVTGDSGKQYRAVATNSTGTVNSNAATLTVNPTPVAPSFTTQPTSTTVTAPNTATFTVIATGTPTPTLQWQLSTNGGVSFADIVGATASSYTTSATVTGDSGKQYRAVATNSAGTVNSNAATLTVNQTPAFTTQPTSVTVTAPATAAFNVAATGTPVPTLQWQLSADGGGTWGDIASATSSSYTTPATVTGGSVKLYRAVATNSAGVANSNVASLTLRTIALPKTGQTACYDAANVVLPSCLNTGQDGELQTGVAEPAPRFVVGTGVGTTDQCVTDNLTGLMWTRNANLPAALQTWQQALDYANALDLCGFTDWRLSNPKELRSLVNHNQANNAAVLNGLAFNNVQANLYWSSSSYAGSPANAWIVDMLDGYVYAGSKSVTYYVWPVRAGQ